MGKYENSAKATTIRVRAPIGERVAGNIEAIRRLRGLSQQQLADRMVEIGRPMLTSAVSKVEKRQRRVDPDDLVAFAVALHVNPSRLLLTGDGGEQAMPLAPALQVPAWVAWQWADGYAPLPTLSEEDGWNADGDLEEFYLFSRPGELLRKARHPLMQALNRMVRRAPNLLDRTPHPAVVDMAKRDVEKIRLALEDIQDDASDRRQR